MAFITLGNLNQLQLEIPTEGTKNWGTNLKNNFVIKLVEHDHSGNGKGAPLGISSFADNVINDVKIRLTNDNYLRARNSTNTGDINLIKAAVDNLTAVIGTDVLSVNNKTIIDNIDAGITNVNTQATLNVNSATKINLNSQVETSGAFEAPSVTTQATFSDSIVTTPKEDPAVPVEGEIMVSDGTDRAAGLWLYLSAVWIQIKRNFTSEPINDTEVKLRNNQYLKARNAANNADVDIVKVNASNVIEFAGSVTATPAVNSVGNTELQDNSVSQSKMQDNSVGTLEIINNSVTAAKLEAALTDINNGTSAKATTANRNINSVNITTTTARPVLVTLSGWASWVSDTSVAFQIRLSDSATVASGVTLSRTSVGGLAVPSIGGDIRMPFSCQYIFTPTIGSNTFYAHATLNSVSSTGFDSEMTVVQL